jgi:hypothetical protein
MLLLEDLESEPAETMRALCVFLGIDSSFEFPYLWSNRAAQPRSRWLHQLMRRPSALKTLLKPVVPRQLRVRSKSFMMRLNLREEQPPEVEPAALQYLTDRFVPENAALSTMIQRDLSSWR